jgi:hypothetical protein
MLPAACSRHAEPCHKRETCRGARPEGRLPSGLGLYDDLAHQPHRDLWKLASSPRRRSAGAGANRRLRGGIRNKFRRLKPQARSMPDAPARAIRNTGSRECITGLGLWVAALSRDIQLAAQPALAADVFIAGAQHLRLTSEASMSNPSARSGPSGSVSMSLRPTVGARTVIVHIPALARGGSIADWPQTLYAELQHAC